jgi:hypothetical protein
VLCALFWIRTGVVGCEFGAAGLLEYRLCMLTSRRRSLMLGSIFIVLVLRSTNGGITTFVVCLASMWYKLAIEYSINFLRYRVTFQIVLGSCMQPLDLNCALRGSFDLYGSEPLSVRHRSRSGCTHPLNVPCRPPISSG